ncbi:DNA-binding protein [Labrys sp. WJW]|uniref:helix-turn-helix transcriptional regulator n=1 Tax=Labrys sp. WJW TaxID=1737983 RepID=UPI0008312630|nr:YafY family protein [Labrys sp. WJW]OCC01397.1 DNA-binding protein [Labrys sp. WJW]
MARTSRLLSLLQILRGKRRPVTAAALAQELAVSERTLYRDIAELVAQGAPIQGEAGIGYILRPGLFLPPLMLSEDETEAIVLGLRYVEQRGDDTLGRSAREALAKIEAVLPPAAQEIARNPVALPGPSHKGFPDNRVAIEVFRSAIRAQAKLRIDYGDLNGQATTRVIWPIAIGFMNEARMLAAWCELREDFRHFRTDRIAAASEIGERYPGRRSQLVKSWRAVMDEIARR